MTDQKKKPPQFVPLHGNGLLNVGSVPGRKGGPGRPPSALRERLRGTIEERVTIIEDLLDDPATSNTDKIRCIDMLLRYAIGTKIELEVEQVTTIDPIELRERILDRARQVRAALPPADDVDD